MLRLDHVVIAVGDLERSAQELLDMYGLASVDGGVHEGMGTGNSIVPLGDTYIELLGIADRAVAEGNAFGGQLIDFLEDGDRLFSWAVATDDITLTARRIGSQPSAWSRTRPDGTVLKWRLAGLEGSMSDRSLPFFIQWDCPPDLHPGRDEAAHRTKVTGITELIVAGDTATIRSRLNGNDLALRVVSGDPGPVSVTVATADGEITIK
jgi:hypothetical protein